MKPVASFSLVPPRITTLCEVFFKVFYSKLFWILLRLKLHTGCDLLVAQLSEADIWPLEDISGVGCLGNPLI